MQAEIDEAFMRLALEAARATLADGNLPIGTVIVHAGRVISTGRNQSESRQVELAHAEMEAITAVQNFLFSHKRECEIYTTLEPCMMCFGAILHSHFTRLIIATPDPRHGALALTQPSEHYARRMPIVKMGVLHADNRELLAEYVQRTGQRLHLLDVAPPLPGLAGPALLTSDWG